MMDFPEDGRAPAFEPIEQMHLPQRAVSNQRGLVDAHRGLYEITSRGSRRQLVVLDMVVDMEIGVVFERRVGQIKGNEHQALSIATKKMQSRGHLMLEFIDGDCVFEKRNGTDVQRSAVRLSVKKSGILRGQPAVQFACR